MSFLMQSWHDLRCFCCDNLTLLKTAMFLLRWLDFYHFYWTTDVENIQAPVDFRVHVPTQFCALDSNFNGVRTPSTVISGNAPLTLCFNVVLKCRQQKKSTYGGGGAGGCMGQINWGTFPVWKQSLPWFLFMSNTLIVTHTFPEPVVFMPLFYLIFPDAFAQMSDSLAREKE